MEKPTYNIYEVYTINIEPTLLEEPKKLIQLCAQIFAASLKNEEFTKEEMFQLIEMADHFVTDAVRKLNEPPPLLPGEAEDQKNNEPEAEVTKEKTTDEEIDDLYAALEGETLELAQINPDDVVEKASNDQE